MTSQLERGTSNVIAPRYQNVSIGQFAGKVGTVSGFGQPQLTLRQQARHVLFERARRVVARAIQDDDWLGHEFPFLS